MSPAIPVAALLAASTLWGLTWLPLKRFGAFGIEGVVVTLVGYGSLGAFAIPWLAARRSTWWSERWTMALLVFFGGLANVSFATAMVQGEVSRVMVLFYLLPAWGVLGGRFLLGERIDGRRRLSVVVALLGAFTILGGPGSFATAPGLVDLAAVAAGFALAMNNVLFRKLRDTPIAPKVAVTFVGCLLWGLGLMAAGLQAFPREVPSGVWVEVVGFGWVWVLVATVGTLFGVHHLEAGRSSVLIIMELLVAVSSAAILTGDVPSPLEWLGAGLILISALLEAWTPGTAPVASPELQD